MKDAFNLFVLAVFCLSAGLAKAQTAEMIMPEKQNLIPGQVVAYLQEDVSPREAERVISGQGLTILKTDIHPVSTILRNPGKEAVNELKKHPSVQEYEFDTVVYDSTSLKNLKFGGNMTEQLKEEARKRFLKREDLTLMFIRFRYEVTQPKAKAILSAVEELGEFNLRAAPRMVYIQVKKGTEPEQMIRLQQLPAVTNVARTAETVATTDF